MRGLRRTVTAATLPAGTERPTAALLILASVFTAALSAPPSAGAQDYQVFGDVEGVGIYHYLEDASAEHRLTGVARLRADHRLFFERAELVADTELELRSPGAADPPAAALAPAPSGSGSGAGGAGAAAGETTGELDYYIDEAYLSLFPLSPVSVSAGKQRANWGSGYSFSPTDSLHPRSASGRDEGFRGLSATWTATPDFTLSAHISADDALDDPDAAAQAGLRYAAYASVFLGNAELYLSGVYGYDATARPGIGGAVSFLGVVVAAEAAVELSSPVVYPTGSGADAGFGAEPVGTPAPLALAAVEYNTGTDTLDVLSTTEYRYAGTGYTRSEAQELYDALAAARTGTGSAGALSRAEALGKIEEEEIPSFLGRHYVAQTLTFGIAGYVELESGIVLNAADLSYESEHTVRVTALSGVDFFATGRFYGGAADTEFGAFPDGAAVPGRLQIELGSVVHF